MTIHKIIRKVLYTFLGACFSLNLYAAIVPGEFSYFLEDNLKIREVSLEVPSRGQGEVRLSFGEKQTLTAKRFYVHKVHNKTYVAIVFQNYPGQVDPDDYFVLWGSYKRTYEDNKISIVYKGHGYTVTQESTPALDDILLALEHYPTAKMVGNFIFKN